MVWTTTSSLLSPTQDHSLWHQCLDTFLATRILSSPWRTLGHVKFFVKPGASLCGSGRLPRWLLGHVMFYWGLIINTCNQLTRLSSPLIAWHGINGCPCCCTTIWPLLVETFPFNKVLQQGHRDLKGTSIPRLNPLVCRSVTYQADILRPGVLSGWLLILGVGHLVSPPLPSRDEHYFGIRIYAHPAGIVSFGWFMILGAGRLFTQ